MKFQLFNASDDTLIDTALQTLESRMKCHVNRDVPRNPDDSQRYLRLKLADLKHEVFACLFLDSRHRVIAYEELFRGTLDGASVYPREVVKAALAHNAAGVIFAHNHPSGDAEPSQADLNLTHRLREALGLVDTRVLDHVIIGVTDSVSMAQRGLV